MESTSTSTTASYTSYKPNYEVRVGLFAVIALIILLWGWSWLKSFSLRPPQLFTVQFHDVAGLTKNAPVQVNGVRVGTVEEILLHGKGQVLCSLRIPIENTIIPQGSTITIQTQGLVGQKYIEITLPEWKVDEPPPPPIEQNATVVGQDPVRTELYMNKIAANLSNVTEALGNTKARESLSKAAQTSGEAMETIKDAAVKFNKNMDKLSDATTSINRTANEFTKGASSASTFFDQGKTTMERVSGLAEDWQKTSHRLNKILANPAFSADLKDTAQLARDTADKIQNAVHELNTTLTDKPVRDDFIAMLNKLSTSTDNIYHSMQVVQNVSGDKDLQTYLKDVLADARDTMNKANDILSKDTFVSDARSTMAKLRTAADGVDAASKNINDVLTRKHILLHLMFGGNSKRPKQVKSNDPGSVVDKPTSPVAESTQIKINGEIKH